MMKVLHIGKYFPPFKGGIESFMSQLMAEQVQQGIAVSALVHTSMESFGDREYEWDGCHVVESHTSLRLLFTPIAPLFLRDLIKVLRRKPDIVHLHMPNASVFWLLVLGVFRRLDFKTVVHWHSDVLGANPTQGIKLFYPLYRIFEKRILKLADLVVATSPNYLNNSEPLKEFSKKSSVIPLGIKLKPAKTMKADQNHELKLIMIGRLSYYKGHQIALKAIHALKESNVNVHLDIIGTGEIESALREQIEFLGIQNNIVMHGHVSDEKKDNLLKSADLLLLPSIEKTEAFGVVLLEAGSVKVPCLVTSVCGSGMSYVIENGKNGFVVPPLDENAIVEAIKVANGDRDNLRRMGQEHYNIVKEKFSINIAAKNILLEYQKLISNNT